MTTFLFCIISGIRSVISQNLKRSREPEHISCIQVVYLCTIAVSIRVVVLGTCTGTWSVLKYHFQVLVLVLVLGTEVLVLVLVLKTWVLVLVLVLETQVLVLVLVLEWLSTGYNSGKCVKNHDSPKEATDIRFRQALLTLTVGYLSVIVNTTRRS